MRRFKGSRVDPPVSRRTVSLSRGFNQWKDVNPEFLDDVGDPVDRNAEGWAGKVYKNDSGRNDIVAAKVAYDDRFIYFYARTSQALTPSTGPNWMLLFLDVDANRKTGWLGYDFVVNRSVGQDSTMLQRNDGNAYRWMDVATVPYRVSANELMIAVPRAELGLAPGPHIIDFKWADGILQTGDVSDLTINGDVAPNDRFNYRARLEK